MGWDTRSAARQGSALPCTPLSLPSHPAPQGRVRLIRIYDALSTTMGCFTLLLISWQFSESESYICVTGGQERWETASALRAGTEDQRCVLGTPWIQSNNGLFSYISCREGNCPQSCLVMFGDAEALHVYTTFPPMPALIIASLDHREVLMRRKERGCYFWPIWTGKPRHGEI